MSATPEIERHPLQPFLPDNARLLMLGSFPPPKERWCMDFFYPNPQNDMWRIMGQVFFGDKQHFVDGKVFKYVEIVSFCRKQGIAIFDTAQAVIRLQGNAADEHLEIVESTDISRDSSLRSTQSRRIHRNKFCRTNSPFLENAVLLTRFPPIAGHESRCLSADVRNYRHVMKTYTATYSSPLGPIVIESDGQAITSLRFSNEQVHADSTTQEKAGDEAAITIPIIAETIQWLDDYFAGKRMENATTGKKEGCRIAVRPKGTPFQQRVWQALLTIPYGKTISYGEIAKMVDCRSAQAVGQAVGLNPIALIIPCHRVIAAHGKIGGYAYGTEIKKQLLELEQL